MSILQIKKHGEPILKQKAKPVEKITPEIKQLIRSMFETMYAAPGVGLAACQVGVPERICVIDVVNEGKRQPIALINPRIVSKKGKAEEEEGCLSFPGIAAKIKRALTVRVEAVNENGMPVTVEGSGLLGRVLQHEIDHLDGKVFLDHLSWWKRRKIEGEIRKKRKLGAW